MLSPKTRLLTLCGVTAPSGWDCGPYFSWSRCAHPLLFQSVSLNLDLFETFTNALNKGVNELVWETWLVTYTNELHTEYNLILLNFVLPETFKLKGPTYPAVAHRCSGRACNPRMGNLAQGRVLSTRSVCGFNSSETYCFFTQAAAPRSRESCLEAKCSQCNSDIPSQAHPPSAMSDSSFRYPDTWWQSAQGAKEETLQLDLETEFLFTHLIMVFRSPRPAAMVLERSQDHGRTWKPLRYFARHCQEAFGLTEGSPVGESGAICTSKYSGAFPCSKGEVSLCAFLKASLKLSTEILWPCKIWSRLLQENTFI